MHPAAALLKNMTYYRETVIHSRLNINERFVSRGKIYDNSTGIERGTPSRRRFIVIVRMFCSLMPLYFVRVSHDCPLP